MNGVHLKIQIYEVVLVLFMVWDGGLPSVCLGTFDEVLDRRGVRVC